MNPAAAADMPLYPARLAAAAALLCDAGTGVDRPAGAPALLKPAGPAADVQSSNAFDARLFGVDVAVT